MKTIIKHRVNTRQMLLEVERHWGAEIDLRSNVQKKGELHLSHDPWTTGENFDSWLDEFQRREITGPLILNTKEDGLEETILEKLKKRGIMNFFFLDTCLPTLIKHVMIHHLDFFALRLSKYEPVSWVQSFEGRAKWIWVDCFGGVPIDQKLLLPFQGKYKVCLVSPELHGFPESQIKTFKNLFQNADAVCTKFPKSWTDLDA